ncbi:MAG: DUF1893 domain-containing protein [Dehalococcoidales bacterium]|nr:DUF1893 domain-containing protein [Dehalococcoidales bacterium]
MPIKTKNQKFEEFLTGQDTLRIYKDKHLIFASRKERLMPLLEYMERFAPYEEDVIVFDRVVGNAAALLLKIIRCREVFSELGSENAMHTLDTFDIRYHFNETVPCIENDSRQDMCPMEKMSLGKNPEDFYLALKQHIQART